MDEFFCKNRYILSKIIDGIFIGIFLLMMWVGYSLFYPFKTIELQDKLIPVIIKQVHAGEKLQVKYNFTKFTDEQAEINITLVNHVILNLNPYYLSLVSGEYHKIGFIEIPSFSPLGTYHAIVNIKYKINPLRTISLDFQTEDFQVVN